MHRLRFSPATGYNIETVTEHLAEHLGLKVTSVQQITWGKWGSTRIYLVIADKDRYILKLKHRPSNGGRRGIAKQASEGLSFRNELSFYLATKQRSYEALKYPKLLSTDHKNYMLFEYIRPPDQPWQARDYEQVAIRALLELQFSELQLPLSSFDRLLKKVRNPAWTTLRTIVTRFRKTYGWGATADCVRLLRRCSASQTALPFKLIVHGDFHPGNILVDNHGAIFVTDFENVNEEGKWPLLDIVRYSVSSHTFDINYTVICDYLRNFYNLVPDPNHINLFAQLRVAFLRSTIQFALPGVATPSVQANAEQFFREIVLSDGAFEEWVRAHIAIDQLG